MPKHDENQATQLNAFPPALTGRLGAKDGLLTLAQKLDKTGPLEGTSYTYSTYAVLDSLSSSYSIFKYGFDLANPNGGADAMHEAMLTPGGIVGIITETLFLVGFSFLASLFEKASEDDCFFETHSQNPTKNTSETSKYIYATDSCKLFYCPQYEEGGPEPFEIELDENETIQSKLRTIMNGVKTDKKLNEEQLKAIAILTNRTYIWNSAHPWNKRKLIATLWPYVRDLIKALKNAYKGWRSITQALRLMGALDFLSAPDLTRMIFWGGLGLGVLATVNRLLLRKMIEDRKVMMGQNADLLLFLKNLSSLDEGEAQTYLGEIKEQSLESRCLAFVGVTAGGLIDGSYLYIGVLSVVVLSQPWLIALAIMCAIYTLACVVSRLYEEYDFQVRLDITRTKCELVIISKQIETLFELLDTNQPESIEKMCRLLAEFEVKRKVLQEQSTRTYLHAALLGIKNGLYAYSALSSILFMISGICLLASASFPPAVLITAVILGLALIAAFLTHSLIVTYLHSKEPIKESSYDRLLEWKATLESPLKKNAPSEIKPLDKKVFQESLQAGFSITPSPTFFYQEWAEVIRSCFSGVTKGQKCVDFIGNPGQVKDEHGHYHDSLPMLIIGSLSAVFFGFVLAGRALARGFGRQKIGCGLLKIPNATREDLIFSDIEPLLKERDAVILLDNNTMCYIDLYNQTIEPIPTLNNQSNFNEFTLRFSDDYKLANETECEFIKILTTRKIQVENDLAGAVGSTSEVEKKTGSNSGAVDSTPEEKKIGALLSSQGLFAHSSKKSEPKEASTTPDLTEGHCTF